MSTFEDLAELHIAAEKLLMVPAADQWLLRGSERRLDEAKLRKVMVDLLSAVNRSVGTPGFVELVRQVEATADPVTGKVSPAAGAIVFQALKQRIDDSVLEERISPLMVVLSRAALRSMNAERELIGLEPLAVLQKTVIPDEEILFREMFPELAASVDGYMVNAVGSHARAITPVLVNAANPASPMAIGPLQRQLRSQIADLTVKRATLIARTETARVYGETAKETQRANGIARSRLATAGNPCPICREEAARGFLPIDELQPIPLHPNCRCDWIPDVENWLPPMPEVVQS